MSLQIDRYRPEDAEDWDAFVARSRNGTFFHTRRFLSYHGERFADHSLVLRDGKTIVGVLPAAAIEDEGRRVLASHPGATYGGLVLAPGHGMAETGVMLDAVLSHAQQQEFGVVRFLRLPPSTLRKQPSDDQEYWLYRNGFSVTRFELATSLLIGGRSEEALLEGYDGKCRNAVRQGMRSGLTVALSEDDAAFWPILEETLESRHKTAPTHTLAQFRDLRATCPGEVRLIAAHEGGRMVAGIVFVTLHERALYTLYIAQNFADRQHRPLPLLVHRLACLAAEEGRDVLHFGVSTEDGGAVANDGLFFFKESFGGVSVRRESWEWKQG